MKQAFFSIEQAAMAIPASTWRPCTQMIASLCPPAGGVFGTSSIVASAAVAAKDRFHAMTEARRTTSGSLPILPVMCGRVYM